MSASKKKQIEIVIRKLTDQLAIAQTELSLIQSYDENGKILPDIKMEEDEGRILVSPCVADDHYGPCNLMSGNSIGVCALCPTWRHAPRWGDPLFCYSMKATKPPWRLQNATRSRYRA